MKPRRLLLAFAIGLGLTLLLLMALNPSPDTARASNYLGWGGGILIR